MATKAVRPARLNRRRYLEITRLLKEVIADRKAGLARRMRAAEMLLGVYDRHDKALEKKERRTELRETGTPETVDPEATPEPVVPKAETVDEFLARVTSRTAVRELEDENGDEELDNDAE